jgi:hypothetical protein
MNVNGTVSHKKNKHKEERPLPTFNKNRYRTHEDILESPRDDDELEREYRNAEIRQAADRLQDRYGDKPRFYRDLLTELAKRQIDKERTQASAREEMPDAI